MLPRAIRWKTEIAPRVDSRPRLRSLCRVYRPHTQADDAQTFPIEKLVSSKAENPFRIRRRPPAAESCEGLSPETTQQIRPTDRGTKGLVPREVGSMIDNIAGNKPRSSDSPDWMR